ncbi:MAG TPA: hypothetical protein VGS17_04920 [Candidatus Limnocylindria bacterium]|nr:hypothetical protein [Candidatus Limnocylindria bacterium]
MKRRTTPASRIRRAEERPADATARLAEAGGAKGPRRGRPGQAVVCASCGTFLGFAGHVNLDLDLRLHREAARCPGTSTRVRWAVPADVDENDLPER